MVNEDDNTVGPRLRAICFLVPQERQAQNNTE